MDTHYHAPLWKEEFSLLPGRGVPRGHVIGFGSVSTGSSGRNEKPREDRGLLPPWLHRLCDLVQNSFLLWIIPAQSIK